MEKEKKSILIIHNTLGVGGADTSLFNFINLFKDEYNISLYIFEKNDNSKIDKIPPCVKIISSRDQIRSTKIPFLFKVLPKTVKNFIYECKMKKIIKKERSIHEEYHLVICFFGFYNHLQEFTIEKTKAQRKVLLVHEDCKRRHYSKTKLNTMKKFDKIFFVSNSISEKFLKMYKWDKNKIDVLYNNVSYENINKDIAEKINITAKSEVVKFISIAGIGKNKAYPRTAKAFGKLKRNGLDFNWYIIGKDCGERKKLERKIKKYKINKDVVLLGERINVFPYINAVDVLLLTSYMESQGMVLSEALLIGKPIIATECVSTKELYGEYGEICENSTQGIYKSIKSLLEDKNKFEKLKGKAKNYSACEIEEKIKTTIKKEMEL